MNVIVQGFRGLPASGGFRVNETANRRISNNFIKPQSRAHRNFEDMLPVLNVGQFNGPVARPGLGQFAPDIIGFRQRIIYTGDFTLLKSLGFFNI